MEAALGGFSGCFDVLLCIREELLLRRSSFTADLHRFFYHFWLSVSGEDTS